MHSALLSHCAGKFCCSTSAACIGWETGCGEGLARRQVVGTDAAATFTAQNAPDMAASAVPLGLDFRQLHGFQNVGIEFLVHSK